MDEEVEMQKMSTLNTWFVHFGFFFRKMQNSSMELFGIIHPDFIIVLLCCKPK